MKGICNHKFFLKHKTLLKKKKKNNILFFYKKNRVKYFFNTCALPHQIVTLICKSVTYAWYLLTSYKCS
jgi:hypothetical protein